MKRTNTYLENNWLFVRQDIPEGFKKDCTTDLWRAVYIPHDWAVSSPVNRDMRQGRDQGFLDRWGVGWYRHTFWLETKDDNCRYLLTFDGVYERSTVWINEHRVGEKNYGYSGFTFDITDFAAAGENLIAVRVDNSDGIADRWYSGAGIYRKVTLTKVYHTHFSQEDIVINTAFSDKNTILTANTGMPGIKTGAKLYWRSEIVAEAISDSGVLSLSIPDVNLWSAETPNLYTLELVLYEGDEAVDNLSLRVGFRDIAFVPQQGLFVNGRHIKLKGVCLHHDAGCVGAAVKKNLWRQRLSVLKKYGCNAIRTSHNIPSSELLDLCDEMGFYVVEESFDKWVSGSYGRFFHSDWETDVSFMVKRDRNRPSVILWSVGNEVEVQGSASMCELLEMLVAKVKELDQVRPVTYAMIPHYWDDDKKEVRGIDNILPLILRIADRVDILSMNYQEPWYEDFHAQRSDKLVLCTEAYLFFQASHSRAFSYNAENPWMPISRHDYVIGGFLWAGVDYIGESMDFPSKGWCGCLIRSNLEPRPIASLFESYWSEKPMVHITMLDYTLQDELVREEWAFPPMHDCWDFRMYRRMPIPYMIFTNCEEVELYLNDIPRDVKKPYECESRIITGYLPLVRGTIRVKGLIGGQVVCEHELISANEAVKLEFTEPSIRLADGECKNQQVLLTVRAVDGKGINCMRESRVVRFVVEGGGIIEGVDNGSMTCEESFYGYQVHMLHGAASVVVRTKDGGGSIIVRAYSDGLISGTAEIHV